MNSASLALAVWSFLVYMGKGMELANQFVSVETNKTVATVVKLTENLDHGHSVDGQLL
jgi:hypothetical protein